MQAYYSLGVTVSNNNITNTDNRSARFAQNIEENNFYENKYYDSLRGDIPESGGTVFQTDPTLNYDDIVFTTDNFTNNPREIRLLKILNQ